MNQKVLLITHTNSFGGAEKILFWLAEKLNQDGNVVSIINLNEYNNCTDYQRTATDSIHIETLTGKGKGKIHHLHEIKAVVKYIKCFSPNVMISFTRLPNAIAGLCGRITHTPTIISERSDPRVWYNSRAISFLLKRASELAQMCVFQTDAAKKYAEKKWKNKSTVIANPIFLPKNFHVIELNQRTSNTIVSLGRFENYQKRYDILLAGFNLFHEKHPDYKLRMFGSGPDEDIIRKWIHELNLDSSVMIKGLSKDPFADLQEDKIFAITSDFEGIPNSLLEAMAMGLPVVSTDCEPGGAKMLINNYENGILIPRGNPEALARALCELAENEELRNKCGRNAVEVIERFNPQRIYELWTECINTVLSS